LWVEEKTEDKLSGYSSMYEIFLGLSKLLAPFIPFITEEIYQNLRTENMPESVHLCDYLTSDEKSIDDELEQGMQQIRELVEVGRALRSKIGIKVRYPLKVATIVCSEKIQNSIKDLLDLLREELNVKTILFAQDADQFMTKAVKPNHSHLGPKYKGKAKDIVNAIESSDTHELYEKLMKDNEVTVTLDEEIIKLTIEDFEVVESEKEHIAKADAQDMTLFLDTTLTPELEAEGFAREIIRRIQSMRKELNLDVEDRIATKIKVCSEKKTALRKWEGYIKEETRSKTVSFVEKPIGSLVKKWKIDELEAEIGISK
jgi:isoleucyl-tRNA synthetase